MRFEYFLYVVAKLKFQAKWHFPRRWWENRVRLTSWAVTVHLYADWIEKYDYHALTFNGHHPVDGSIEILVSVLPQHSDIPKEFGFICKVGATDLNSSSWRQSHNYIGEVCIPLQYNILLESCHPHCTACSVTDTTDETLDSKLPTNLKKLRLLLCFFNVFWFCALLRAKCGAIQKKPAKTSTDVFRNFRQMNNWSMYVHDKKPWPSGQCFPWHHYKVLTCWTQVSVIANSHASFFRNSH